MSLNKKILKKVGNKTENDTKMQNFILNILNEENKGIGHYTKFYRAQLDEAVKED